MMKIVQGWTEAESRLQCGCGKGGTMQLASSEEELDENID